MRRAACLVLLLSFGVSLAARSQADPWPYDHFRVAQPRARQLVQAAVRRSPTIREMLGRLESSDVIAFFVVSPFLSLPTGRTSFLSATSANRMLNVVLNERNGDDDLLALLGHELQHVLEVAAAPDVRNTASFEQLYQQIGAQWARGCFETDGAVSTWRQVRKEVAQDRG